jgi:hypothetical protein
LNFILKTFLLSARRERYGLTNQYIISIDSIEIKKTSSNYIGKLKRTINSNNFTLYDDGSDDKKDLDKPLRCELGYFIYVF